MADQVMNNVHLQTVLHVNVLQRKRILPGICSGGLRDPSLEQLRRGSVAQ